MGIKQLQEDPMDNYIKQHEKDTVVKATVKEVDAKQATLELANDVTAILRASDYSYDRVNDLREEINVGEELDVKVINIDRKNHQIFVSLKALHESGGATSGASDAANTTLGDLLKEQMEQNNKDK